MMVPVLAATPLAISVAFGLFGPRLSRAVSGRAATVLITVVSLVCALAMGLVACAIGALALAELPPLAALGHWSPSALAHRAPVSRWIGLMCLAAGVGLLCAACVQVFLIVRRLRPSIALCRACSQDLVVVDDGPPDAYALAGLPGRTVVTRSMLRLLSGPERSALLAHERSHVAHHHFVYVNLVQLAAAANPFLRPLTRAVRSAVERWADEDAATQVADRLLVATTLARASLARYGTPVGRPDAALAAVASDVRQRIDALVTPARTRLGPLVVGMLVVAALSAAISSGVVGLDLHNLVEWAQAIRSHPPS